MKEKITVQNFVNEFIEKKITNTKATPDAVEKFINNKLEIVDYLPFQTKREITELIVAQNITEEYGVKKIDDIAQYLCFVVAMLTSHTNLIFSKNPSEDYDALSKNGLLEPIIEMFRKDFSECETLLKMAVTNEFADNNLMVIVGKFLNGVLDKFEGLKDILKGFIGNTDVSKLLGKDMNEENIAKILGFVDKHN